jgi:hypothetical protein
LSTTHLATAHLLKEGLGLRMSCRGVLHASLLLLGHECLKLHLQLWIL